jgi:hypothetical protein
MTDESPVPATAPEGAPIAASTRRMLLEYTALRLGMFLGVAALMLFFVHGQNGFFVAIVVAAIVSGVASYFLLQRQRAPLADALDRRISASRAESARRTASEDEAADALRAEQESGPGAT